MKRRSRPINKKQLKEMTWMDPNSNRGRLALRLFEEIVRDLGADTHDDIKLWIRENESAIEWIVPTAIDYITDAMLLCDLTGKGWYSKFTGKKRIEWGSLVIGDMPNYVYSVVY